MRQPFNVAVAGLIVVTASIVGILVDQSESSAAPSFRGPNAPGAPALAPPPATSSARSFNELPRGDQGGATTEDDGSLTEDDGDLPNGVTVFEDDYPGIANLDPDLLEALRGAGRKAADEGIGLYVKSGWRSRNYQDQLLREAVAEYGSEKEAARWVATADTSPHVSGDAVDIGSVDASAWLSEHGAEFRLCQIYRNEPWHFELRPHAIGGGCPRMYADPTDDPRMQR